MKHLLSGVALAAVLAIATPIWAQAPSTAAPAASEKATAAPGATASHWVQPKPRRHAHRVRRYARYGYYPYYGYYRWGSPTDHMARQLNAQQLYGGGWGGGPYSRSRYVPYD
jgi:Ni/Co efflux regulator RcnB